MDLIKHLREQQAFSHATFGPPSFKDHRGPIDHLRKELVEVEEAPGDPMEWADILLLAFDGAMRAGHSPEQIAQAITYRLEINKRRSWPDWRGTDHAKAIEHVRS
jgi:hypothetical protein